MRIVYEDNCENALMLNDYDLIYIMNEFKLNGKDLRESVESLYKGQFGENIDSYRVWIYYDEKKGEI